MACRARQPVQCAGTSAPGSTRPGRRAPAGSAARTAGRPGGSRPSGRTAAGRRSAAWPYLAMVTAPLAAAGNHYQAPAADIDDERLIVEDERIGLPAPVEPGLLRRDPRLVPCGPGDLAGDQHRPPNKKLGWRSSMMSKPAPTRAARLVVGSSRGSRPGSCRRRCRRSAGGSAPAGWPADRADQPVDPGGVIEVTVAAHDGLDRVRVDVQAAHVLGDAVRAGARVEQNLCSCPALVTVTSTENPCSAMSASGTCPSAIIASGRHGLRSPPAGPVPGRPSGCR